MSFKQVLSKIKARQPKSLAAQGALVGTGVGALMHAWALTMSRDLTGHWSGRHWAPIPEVMVAALGGISFGALELFLKRIAQKRQRLVNDKIALPHGLRLRALAIAAAHKDVNVRNHAAYALTFLKHPDTLPIFAERLKVETDPQTRETLIQGVRAFATKRSSNAYARTLRLVLPHLNHTHDWEAAPGVAARALHGAFQRPRAIRTRPQAKLFVQQVREQAGRVK